MASPSPELAVPPSNLSLTTKIQQQGEQRIKNILSFRSALVSTPCLLCPTLPSAWVSCGQALAPQASLHPLHPAGKDFLQVTKQDPITGLESQQGTSIKPIKILFQKVLL